MFFYPVLNSLNTETVASPEPIAFPPQQPSPASAAPVLIVEAEGADASEKKTNPCPHCGSGGRHGEGCLFKSWWEKWKKRDRVGVPSEVQGRTSTQNERAYMMGLWEQYKEEILHRMGQL
jgi:hypothetical protein